MQIEHLAIWTHDLEPLRLFYRTYFRARSGEKYRNPSRGFESYFLTFSHGARLEIMTLPGLPEQAASQPNQCGLAHFAICVGGTQEVDLLAARLEADGYTLAGRPRWTGDGYYEAVVLDPDGNRVEFTASSRRPAADLLLRDLLETDCENIEAAFSEQGWQKPAAQYRGYLNDQAAGQRDVILAEFAGKFAGYVTILWESHYLHFREAGIPEIMDFNVLTRLRRQGIGTALMDEAERRIAARLAPRLAHAGLGVGLLPEYGPAQILYIQRGYLPDGRGIFHGEHACQWGDTLRADDDLVLYLVKPL